MVTGRAPRVAILGGDSRYKVAGLEGCRVRVFQGRRYGGNGPLRRLERALKAGGIDRVVVLARWNGHSATTKVLRMCRRLGVMVNVVP